jgi:AcrR family transcriptional regulator
MRHIVSYIMKSNPTQSSIDRQSGKYQVDEQRENILQAAETLFLQNGLENTSMIDITRQAGITRATLYRYFQNRDEIAVQIQMRMMGKIQAVLPGEGLPSTLEEHRQGAQQVIRNFDRLRDAYRYIGMFDRIYLDNTPDNALAQWTKARLVAGGFDDRGTETPGQPLPWKELGVILSTITWFLEKLALRGELTWSDPGVPLEEHLQFFEEMIMRSFDQLEEKKRNQK